MAIVEILRQAPDWTIELHGAHLDRGASDAEVVTYCGTRGWALVTCDDMRYTPETKRAIAEHNVRVIKVVVKKKTLGVEIASSLIIARDKIIGFLKNNRTAIVAHIQKDGSINVRERFDQHTKGLTASQQRTERKHGAGRLF